MWFKLTNAEFEKQKGDGNREAMRRRVEAGETPGLLAYHRGRAVGWCAVEPRSDYPRLDRSRILKKVDDQPVWSLTCFYGLAEFRGRGLTEKLIRAAAAYAQKQGGRILEAYPVDARGGRISNANAYHGLCSTFLRLGFREAARRKADRPVMRLDLK